MFSNAAEDTFFIVKKTLSCRGRLLDLSTPLIMGILNLTPDSFYEGKVNFTDDEFQNTIHKLITGGADIIDVGGQSTRPGAQMISAEEEWKRISRPLELINKNFPDVVISVDTFYSEVAENAIRKGASIINDVSAGSIDERITDIAAKYHTPYVLMHMKGTPSTMQKNPEYENVVKELLDFFIFKTGELKSKGINDIIIDPGFGFGKTVEHNYTLLKNLHLFRMMEYPVMAGLSRKSMVTKVLDKNPSEALNGTTVLNTIALLNGASILRVHDVAEAVEVKKIVQKFQTGDLL